MWLRDDHAVFLPTFGQVEHLLVNLPGAFRAKPLQTGLITASLFPFSLIIIAVLPAVLIVDYMVQASL